MDATEMDVIATTASGPDAPALRARLRIALDELARRSVNVASIPLFSREEYQAFSGGAPLKRFSVAVAARQRLRDAVKSHPAPVGMIQRQADVLPSLELEHLVADGRRLIYDVDDAIWLAGTPAARGHPLAMLKGARRKVRWLATRADHVVAGNELLAEELGRYAQRITVIPSLVETRVIPVRRHETKSEIVLGWIGSTTTAPYLQSLLRWLPAAARELRDFRIRVLVVGGEPPRLNGVTSDLLPWSPDAELEALSRMDIGLMPLPDDPWTRGKCAYKAIQYMAAGVPVVADDVGVTARVVGNEAGVIAHGEADWTEAVVELARDTALRKRMGAAGRTRAEADFSVQRWAGTLAGILQGKA